MANYAFANLTVKIDPTDGGALTDISAQVLSINGVKVDKLVEDVTAAGLSFAAWLQTGLKKFGGMIGLELLYDDTGASTSKAIFVTSAHTATRTLELTYGSTNKTTVECWIADYEYQLANGKVTRLKVSLQPTGTITEA